jgi:hypothetical protein
MASPFVLGKLADHHGLHIRHLNASDMHVTGIPSGLGEGVPMAGGFKKAMQHVGGETHPLSPRDHVLHSSNAILAPHEKLIHETQRWVAQTFYGTVLKHMHDSPFKASWVDGGRGGQAFQPFLDQQMVDHMSKTSSRKLVNSIVKKIEGKRSYTRTNSGVSTGSALPKPAQTPTPATESYVPTNFRA